ncbi:MAG TPA: hypothetical protein DC063_13500 [Arenimonas sp.]|nr:MAG: hypothetical protein A2X76_04105 [Xanthomonadales bacterium GWF1_69_6]HBD20986.1 hypothetical protein [Arenimonas sp.]
MRTPTPRRAARGFTLMEMLVVLMLLALTVGLVFDALGMFRISNERIQARTAQQRAGTLVESWLADSIAGLRPGRDPEPVFAGRDDGFIGLSLQPVRGGAGAPAPVAWSLESDADGAWLAYRQGEAWSARFPAPEAAVGFAYLDRDGRWHEVWPPRLGVQRPLPEAVALAFDDGRRQWLRPVAVLGPSEAFEIPFELERD